MPLIEVHMLEGRTDEQKEKLLAAVTKAVHESIGAPLQSIRVWIQEISSREFMSGGELAANRK
jgi:4-oxalocrotonate tautomerase